MPHPTMFYGRLLDGGVDLAIGRRGDPLACPAVGRAARAGHPVSSPLVAVRAPVDRRPRAGLLDPIVVLGDRVHARPGGGDRPGDIAAPRVAAPGERIVAPVERRRIVAAGRWR